MLMAASGEQDELARKTTYASSIGGRKYLGGDARDAVDAAYVGDTRRSRRRPR